MNSTSPKISVLMAVYNGEKYLRETLDSLLAQTFKDFECVIIDDCSSDSTPEILKEYADKDARFRVFRNEQNKRLAGSLNAGLEHVRGKYTARIDADDIALPERLEKQFAFMEKHPDVTVSYCRHFLLKDGVLNIASCGRNISPRAIPAMFLLFCPVLHPGAIVKSETIKKYRYNPLHSCSEDMELWTRMIIGGEKIECQNEFLMLYRIHGGQITSGSMDKQKKEVALILKAYYKEMLGCDSAEVLDYVLNTLYFCEKNDIKGAKECFDKIVEFNKKAGKFSEKAITGCFFEVLSQMQYQYKFNREENRQFYSFNGLQSACEGINQIMRSFGDVSKAKKQAKKLGFEVIGKYRKYIPYFRYTGIK